MHESRLFGGEIARGALCTPVNVLDAEFSFPKESHRAKVRMRGLAIWLISHVVME